MLNYICTVFLLLPTLVLPQACNELIILAGSESEQEEFLLHELFQALYEEQAPVLVEAKVLKRFLDVQQHAANKRFAGLIRKFAQGHDHPWPVIETELNKIVKLFGEDLARAGMAAAEVKKQLAWYRATFRAVYIPFPQGWRVYKSQDASSLVLLIPDQYCKHRGTQSLEALGFQGKQLLQLKSQNAEVLLEELQAIIDAEIYGHDSFEKAFQKIIAPNKALGAPWLFYWAGHGNPPERRNIQEIAREIRFLNEVVAAEPDRVSKSQASIKEALLHQEEWKSAVASKDVANIVKVLVTLAKANMLGSQVPEAAPVLFDNLIKFKVDPLVDLTQKIETVRKNLADPLLSEDVRARYKKPLQILQENHQAMTVELGEFEQWVPHVGQSVTAHIENLELNQLLAGDAPKKVRAKIQALEAQKKQREGKFRGRQFIPGARAGVSFAAFKSVITFMSNRLDTRCIYLKTCFSGGVNQRFLQDMLQGLKSPCMVISTGTSESIVYADSIIQPLTFVAGAPVLGYSSSYGKFFELLCDYFTNQDAFVKKVRAIGTKGSNPLTVILKTITPSQFTITNQPFVYIPQAGVFSAIALDENVFIVTDVVARAALLERKPIDVRPYFVTLIFPAYIPAPLIIAEEKDKKIISQRNQGVTNRFNYGATHLFEGIQLIADVPSFGAYYLCKKFVESNASLYKLFLIKRLNSGTYHFSDVIIRMRGNSKDDGIGGDIDLFFTGPSGKSMYGTLRIDSFKDFTDDNLSALGQNTQEFSPRQLINFATETVERFEQARRFVGKPGLTKQQAALVQEFEEFKKNASLPLLFETLAQDLTRPLGVDAVEKQKSVGEVLQEKIERSKKEAPPKKL